LFRDGQCPLSKLGIAANSKFWQIFSKNKPAPTNRKKELNICETHKHPMKWLKTLNCFENSGQRLQILKHRTVHTNLGLYSIQWYSSPAIMKRTSQTLKGQ
jgi:hypothetical protein